MLGSPLLDAAAGLAAAALYYVWPLVMAWLRGDNRPPAALAPSEPPPFLLPVAVPRPERPQSPEPAPARTLSPPVGERLDALQTLWRYYVSIGMPQGEIEEILRPHLLHLVR